MDFNTYLTNTLSNEGGYTVDNGVPTNYGIRQDIYDAYTKSKGVDNKDVKDVNWGDVKSFYKSQYYDNAKLDLVPSQKVAGVVFDFGVNAGTGKAVRELQKAVGTKADGKIGKKTVAAINKYVEENGEDSLAQSIEQSRRNHYMGLATQNPEKYGRYLKGWMNRLDKLKSQYNY